jgi:hypothetical protein
MGRRRCCHTLLSRWLTVVNFTTVDVSWQSPTGDFTRIRLVRNHLGYREHSEDGVIVYDEYATAGAVSTT